MKLYELLRNYVAHRLELVKSQELSKQQFKDCERILIRFAYHVGDVETESVTPEDFKRFRATSAQLGGLDTLRKHINVVRALFTFGVKNRLILREPFYGMEFDPPGTASIYKERKQTDRSLSRMEILANACCTFNNKFWCPYQWKAIVLLGINAAYGPSDIANVRRSDIHENKITLPRVKNGKPRLAFLWPETLQAIKDYLLYERPAMTAEGNDLLFINSRQRSWSRKERTGFSFTCLSHYFQKLLPVKRSGVGFYSLRRTFATVAEEARDIPAVGVVMGHVDRSMQGVYRQYISDERVFKVCEHVRNWLFAPYDTDECEAELLNLPAETKQGVIKLLESSK